MQGLVARGARAGITRPMTRGGGRKYLSVATNRAVLLGDGDVENPSSPLLLYCTVGRSVAVSERHA